MFRILLPLIIAPLATQANAQASPISGEAFEQWVRGQTYYSSRAGEEPYGMLLYRENRQVTWASLGDECVEGSWSEPIPGVICFDYPAWGEQYCWQFFTDGSELYSVFYEGNGDLYYDQPTTDTMPCLAPYLGA